MIDRNEGEEMHLNAVGVLAFTHGSASELLLRVRLEQKKEKVDLKYECARLA